MSDPYLDEDYGEPCEHIKALRQYLETHGLSVSSEHGEPQGWVNVACNAPGHFTYEGLLYRPGDEED